MGVPAVKPQYTKGMLMTCNGGCAHLCVELSTSMEMVTAGSGYLAACMGVMVAPNGHVLGIEQHELLAQRSAASIRCAVFLSLP